MIKAFEIIITALGTLIISLGCVFIGYRLAVSWDKQKEEQKKINLLKIVYQELENNKDRLEGVFKSISKLFPDISKKDIINGFRPNKDQFSKLSFVTPQKYATNAWKSLIFSGCAGDLSHETISSIYDAYEKFEMINFFSDTSVMHFNILSFPNNWDQKMLNGLDEFSKWDIRREEVLSINVVQKAINSIGELILKN